MIGNDIVDLALAWVETNWKRSGYLDKIFTLEEQWLILKAEFPAVTLWNLWSRKEAAYKIYNRETGIRGYFPRKLACTYLSETQGTVSCNGRIYHTTTSVTDDFVYTVAADDADHFNRIQKINSDAIITKIDGIPFLIDNEILISNSVSITHHGRFWKGIMLS